MINFRFLPTFLFILFACAKGFDGGRNKSRSQGSSSPSRKTTKIAEKPKPTATGYDRGASPRTAKGGSGRLPSPLNTFVPKSDRNNKFVTDPNTGVLYSNTEPKLLLYRHTQSGWEYQANGGWQTYQPASDPRSYPYAYYTYSNGVYSVYAGLNEYEQQPAKGGLVSGIAGTAKETIFSIAQGGSVGSALGVAAGGTVGAVLGAGGASKSSIQSAQAIASIGGSLLGETFPKDNPGLSFNAKDMAGTALINIAAGSDVGTMAGDMIGGTRPQDKATMLATGAITNSLAG